MIRWIDAITRKLATFLAAMISLVALQPGCSTQKQDQICRVLVASSARDATQKAIDAFVGTFEGDRPEIVVVSGPSNGLSQQILAGAPANLFIAANSKWTAVIEDRCDLTEQFIGNRLVLATHRLNTEQEIQTLRDLENERISNIALAAESVPLGDYAMQVLGLSNELQTTLEPKLVFGKDASTVVAWLENREADFGFVYGSDLQRSSELKEALAIDPACHEPITYAIAKLKNDQHDDSALRDQVYDWLRSEESMQIYKDAGFVPMPEKPSAVSKSIE